MTLLERVIFALTLLCVSACGSGGEARPGAASHAPAAEALELYLLPCGRVHVHDLDVFDCEGAYAGQEADLVATCALVRHPSGDLLWDTGIASSFPASGVRAGPFTLFPAPPLSETLSRISLTPSDIEWVALSHSHGDHVGNIRQFVGSRLLMQRAEIEYARRGHADSFVDAFDQRGHLIALDGERDVFGDGSVRILPAPGHTPGHQVLAVELPQTGTVVLSGDLFHFAENREHRRVPRLNTDPEATLRSMEQIEAFIEQHHALLVIQHDPSSIASQPEFPTPLR